MRKIRLITIAIACVVLTLPAVAVTFTDGVPLYTREDLDKMFGPLPKETATKAKAPAGRTDAEDWAATERFIERENARIEAERQYDIQRRSMAGGSCDPAAGNGYSGSYFPAWWLYPVDGFRGRDFHPGGRLYRPQNPQLPFGNTQLPRALPPGGLQPTLKSHPTAPTFRGPGAMRHR